MKVMGQAQPLVLSTSKGDTQLEQAIRLLHTRQCFAQGRQSIPEVKVLGWQEQIPIALITDPGTQVRQAAAPEQV